jgi:HEPN domain-containing protein
MSEHNAHIGDAFEWIKRSKSDLKLAKSLSDEVLYEDLCFHAQQACEKAIKALLVSQHISFSKTHNINTLLKLLPSSVPIPSMLLPAGDLSDYAVTTRYPGDYIPISEEDWKDSVKLAEEVIKWVEGKI